MNLTKYERETIILFNEAEDTAEISTYSRRLQHRLDHLEKEYPGKVKRTRRGACGLSRYILPKRLIAIHKPYNDERRESDRQRQNTGRFTLSDTDSNPAPTN